MTSPPISPAKPTAAAATNTRPVLTGEPKLKRRKGEDSSPVTNSNPHTEKVCFSLSKVKGTQKLGFATKVSSDSLKVPWDQSTGQSTYQSTGQSTGNPSGVTSSAHSAARLAAAKAATAAAAGAGAGAAKSVGGATGSKPRKWKPTLPSKAVGSARAAALVQKALTSEDQKKAGFVQAKRPAPSATRPLPAKAVVIGPQLPPGFKRQKSESAHTAGGGSSNSSSKHGGSYSTARSGSSKQPAKKASSLFGNLKFAPPPSHGSTTGAYISHYLPGAGSGGSGGSGGVPDSGGAVNATAIRRATSAEKQSVRKGSTSSNGSSHSRSSNSSSSNMSSSNPHADALARMLDSDDDGACAGGGGAAGGDAPEVIDSLTAVTLADSDVIDGVCVECEERAATKACNACMDLYCDMCFTVLHRKGKRAAHACTPAAPESIEKATKALDAIKRTASGVAAAVPTKVLVGSSALGIGSEFARYSPEWFVERAQYIPLRLQMQERKKLRLVKAALSVSDYTSKVDTPALQKSSAKRMHRQVREICSIFSGLIVGTVYKHGQTVIEERCFDKPIYANHLGKTLEYARRHKIMNPEKMRTNFGKMVFMEQDAETPAVNALLNFSCVNGITTVYTQFEAAGILGALREPAMRYATMEILPEEGKSRSAIQAEIKRKERAQESIARKYANHKMDKDGIKWCLYSISDNSSFLNSNRLPIDKMVAFLKQNFRGDAYEDGFSLAISGGIDGARLTHSHGRQYNYVLQSLTLWREITDDMFRLWYLAEEDLIDAESAYALKDTGQGLQRVQASPRILSAMRTILHRCQVSLGSWVGSSVIHLGDTNVPNALLFIDKYTQVSKILTPIVLAIQEIKKLMKKPPLAKYINDTYGGPEALKKMILYDFFKNAFDGSGADNFFDAGSCIDGRLTSAWHWCSTLPEKPFFPIFKLAGFTGFDGDFQE